MMISSRGRYALRVMTDLAGQPPERLVPLKEIADRQGLSRKYLETIMATLSKNGLVAGQHGKGGGYRLTREPRQYTIGEILRLTEGDLAPVACLECNAQQCARTADCRTLPMWSELNRRINEYLDSVTIADFMK